MSFSYLPLFTGDYLRDTRHLTPMRHGVYLLALMHCWDAKAPMPLDEQECAGICNCRSTDEVDALRYVLGKYFVRMDDGHYNVRMAAEVAKAERLARVFSDAGLKSAEARREKAREGKRNRIEATLNLGSKVGLTKPEGRLVSPSPSPSPSPSQDQIPNTNTPATQVCARPSERAPDCPHLGVLKLWAEVLPAMAQHDPEMWRGTRADHLRARWRETAEAKGWTAPEEGMAYFRKLFGYCKGSEFLMGRTRPAQGRRPFAFELQWLVRPENWIKVHEGDYHREGASA